MVQIFKDGHLFADLFNKQLVCRLAKRVMLLLHLSDLLWSYVEIRNGQLFHGILIVSLLNEIDRAICSFANELDDLEASDELFGIIFNQHEVAHFFKVHVNLIQAFDR